MSPFIHHEEHVTNVYTDATSQMRVEKDVARQAIPVAIEGQTNKFAFAIEHGRATISTRNIVIGEETKVQVRGVFIGVTTKICL